MKLPLLSGREVLAALLRLGFVEIHRQGSHVKMEHPDGRRMCSPFTMKLIVTHSKARWGTRLSTSRNSSSTSDENIAATAIHDGRFVARRCE